MKYYTQIINLVKRQYTMVQDILVLEEYAD